MNKQLATQALIGTAQAIQSTQKIHTETPVDTLLPSTADAEHTLLLSAGASIVYERAAQMVISDLTTPEPAPAETQETCPRSITPLLESLLNWEFGNDTEPLLAEVLHLMHHYHLRLPYELLPFALNHGTPPAITSAAIGAVLGTRGRWLSRFNPSWSWAGQFFEESELALPNNAETLWQEGTLTQRREILRRLRSINPAQAREWLSAVWKQEKAETRGGFISNLETGLSIDDEVFLEQALDDRGSKVREIASSLLSRLPDSALAQRMRARANALLTLIDGTLNVTLPTIFDAQLLRDCGIDQQSNKQEIPSLYRARVLQSTPPTHWETQFQRSPAEIISCAHGMKWEEAILEHWTRAALHFHSSTWFAPLWDWWLQALFREEIANHETPREMHRALAAAIPAYAEQSMQQLEPATSPWIEKLIILPTPWSDTFSRTYLNELHIFAEAQIKKAEVGTPQTKPRWMAHVPGNPNNQKFYAWSKSLSIASKALAPSSISDMLREWPGLTDNQYPDLELHSWYQELQHCQHILQTRQRLIEGITQRK